MDRPSSVPPPAPPSASAAPRPPAATPAPWLPAWLPLPAELPPRRLVAAAGVAAAVVVVVVVAFAFLRAPAAPAPRLTLPRAGDDPVAAAPPSTGTPGPSAAAPAMLTVHAAGAVANPGVYTVPAGARVADVVTAAGGPLPEADVDRLNLAAHVADGDRVFVPRKGDPATGGPDDGAGGAGGTVGGVATGAPTTAAGPLDLNAATAEQLDGLPGVGPATAQAIISYRTRHGRFRSVTELLDVPGIGPAKLEAVRPLVKV